jgi:predicted extracellular nuclease
MSTRLKSRIVMALAACTLVVFSLSVTSAARAQSQQSAQGLTGAWWVTVNVYECSTLAVRGRFTSMLLFSRGGTVTETTSNPAFLPGQRSVGFGTWALNDDGTYYASDVAFILFAGGAAPTQFQQGTQKLTHTITLNNDASQWTDQATVDFYTAAGIPIAPMHACATATATRLQ